MVWRIDDPQGDEAGKVKYLLTPYTRMFRPDGERAAVLDFGCGPSKAFPHFIGVDNCKDTELFNIAIRPDVNCDVADPKAVYNTFEPGSADAIFSSHCLEHIENHEAALRAWWDIIKVGGHLILYLPHRDYYPNIGEKGANPDHKHDFTASDIIQALDEIGCYFDVLVNETRTEGMEYSFLLVFEKRLTRKESVYTYLTERFERKDGLKTACVVRYGGFGDMLQVSAILPELKRQGFHVTVMTTPRGQSVIEHDPHVDEWLIQDEDQVPNHELHLFWGAWQSRFDHFVQLSESIEGTLLAIPGRVNFYWPDHLRRRELGKNYAEWTADLAGVEFKPEGRFYATLEEAAQCQRYLAHVKAKVATAAKPKARNAAQAIMGLPPKFARDAVPLLQPVFNIVWCLSGSSIHKAYPHMDAVIARILLEMPEAAIHLVGDEACQILEAGWENEARVFRQSGLMNIRQTLTLAQSVDCVLGPETGVLNAVAYEPEITKVLMLSHSSHENLPKHWANTLTIEPNPEHVPCFPCHRLHYNRDHCPMEQETHAAICAYSIHPDTVFEAVKVAYQRWKAPVVQRIDEPVEV